MKTLLLACWWVLLVCGAALAQPAPQDPAALRPRAKLSPAELDKLLTQLKDFDILGPPPMQVRIVRSDAAGCEPNCPEWISAQGRIVADTLPRFKAVLQSLGTRKLPILIDSNGGAVHEALAIGRLIRARGLDVAVALTRLSPCPPDQPRCRFNAKPTQPFPGRPVGPFAKCASSCAFILAAGTHRYVGRLTRVGVHQVTSSQTYAKVLRRYKIVQQPGLFGPAKQTKQLISEEKLSEKTVETQTGDATYAKIKAYFAEMGIADAIVAILMTTLPTDIHWLTPAELADTRMVTDQKDGEELITGVVRPAPNPTAGFNPARPSATPLFQQGCSAFGGAAAGCIFAGLPAKPNTPRYKG